MTPRVKTKPSKPKSLTQLRKDRETALQTSAGLAEKIAELEQSVEWGDPIALRNQRALKAETAEVKAYVDQLDDSITKLEEHARQAEHMKVVAAQQANIEAAEARRRLRYERAMGYAEAMEDVLIELAADNRTVEAEELKLLDLCGEPAILSRERMSVRQIGTWLFGMGDVDSSLAWKRILAPELIRALGGFARHKGWRHTAAETQGSGTIAASTKSNDDDEWGD